MTPLQAPCRPPAPAVQGACTADLWPHPLTAEGRQTLALPLAGATVEDVLRAALPLPLEEVAHALAVTLDGRQIAPAAWRTVPVRAGQAVVARAALAGGGGSDPLRTVLMVALIATAIAFPHIAPASLGLLTTTAGVTTVTLTGSLVSAGILLAGTLVLNALLPPPVPDGAGAPGQPDPVYTIAAGANRARPYGPLLLVLGRHQVHPDLAAREYTEFRGDDQYLSAIYSFGIGDLAISDLRVGDTPLADYDEVRRETVRPGRRVTLVATDVDTVGGAELTDTEWVRRTTPTRTGRIAVDLTGRIFRVDGSATRPHEVAIRIRWRRADSSRWSERRLTLTHDSSAPYRRSEPIRLPRRGVWEVEVRRDEEPDDDDLIYDDVSWAALRSYQDSAEDRGADTRMAVDIRASGQIAGRIDRLSALVEQRVPTWTGTAWTKARSPSTNPAAVLRAFTLGWHDTAGRLLAGAGRDPETVDDAVLGRWHEWCVRHDLHCSLALTGGGVEEIEAVIARCGLATVSWATARFGVVWQDPDDQPVSLITPARVLPGSVTARWAAGEAAEEIVVRYVDADADWQQREVRRLLPGVRTPRYSAAITERGVTSRRQAAIVANLQAATQIYHRRALAWEMGRDGAALARGDVHYLSHDLVSGGIAGRLAGGAADRLTLDRAVALDADSWLLLESPGGDLHQSAVAAPAGQDGETADVVLAAPLPEAPETADDGVGPADWVWRLYSATTPPLRVRITRVEPVSETEFRVEAIDEVAAYHAALTADLDVDLPVPRAALPRVVAIALGERLIRVGRGYAVEIAAALTVAGDWRGGVVRASQDGGPEITVAILGPGETEARWTVQPSGAIAVTAIPGSEAAPAGRPLTAAYTVAGLARAPAPPAGFYIDLLGDDQRRWRWADSPDIDVVGYRIRYAPAADDAVWDEARPLHAGLITSSPYTSLAPPAGAWRIGLRAEDALGTLSDAVWIEAELPPARSGDTLYWSCPPADGWPGDATRGAVLSDDGRAALEAAGAYAWDDLTTWGDWATWATGPGGRAVQALSYIPPPADFGLPIGVTVDWSAEAVGAVAVDVRAGPTETALRAAPWTPYQIGVLLRGPWVQPRWRLAADGSDLLSLAHLCWSLSGEQPDERTDDVFHYRSPAADGWPGGVTRGAVVSDDGRAALEAAGAYAWTDLTTWGDWATWATGPGGRAVREVLYAPPPDDLGAVIGGQFNWSAEIVGMTTVEIRAGATEAAVLAAPWLPISLGTIVRNRWIQPRWRLSGDGDGILSIVDLLWTLAGTTTSEQLLDADTATWPGSAAAGRIVPLSRRLSVVTHLSVTLQSAGAGWSWEQLSRAPATIRIHDGDGQPADAIVDVLAHGIIIT